MSLETSSLQEDSDSSRFPVRASIPFMSLLGLDRESSESELLKASRDLFKDSTPANEHQNNEEAHAQQPESHANERRMQQSMTELDRRLRVVRRRLNPKTVPVLDDLQDGNKAAFLKTFDRFLEEWSEWHGSDQLAQNEGLAEFSISGYIAKLEDNYRVPFLLLGTTYEILYFSATATTIALLKELRRGDFLEEHLEIEIEDDCWQMHEKRRRSEVLQARSYGRASGILLIMEPMAV